MLFVGRVKECDRLAIVCNQLQTLFKRGVPLLLGLEELQHTKRDDLNRIYKSLLRSFQRGDSLFKGLSMWLPGYYPVNSEALRELPKIDLFLDRFYHRLIHQKESYKEVSNQVMYPLVLLVSMCLFIVFFLWILLPIYLNFFKELAIETPPLIQRLTWFTGFLSNYGALIVISLCVLCFSFSSLFWQLWQRGLSSLGFDDGVSNLCFFMGVLLTSGLTLKHVLECISYSKSDALYGRFSSFQTLVHSTGHFSDSFIKVFLISEYDQLLLRYSEKNACLEDALFDLSDRLERLQKERLEFVIRLIQPVSILLISGLVFFASYFLFIPIVSSLTRLL